MSNGQQGMSNAEVLGHWTFPVGSSYFSPSSFIICTRSRHSSDSLRLLTASDTLRA